MGGSRSNVFKYPPEKVGSLWDITVGAAEVAAGARAARAGGQAQEPNREARHSCSRADVLYLEMPTPRSGAERLRRRVGPAQALFVDGDEIDTERLRKYYAEAPQGVRSRRDTAPLPATPMSARRLRTEQRSWAVGSSARHLALVALGALGHECVRGGSWRHQPGVRAVRGAAPRRLRCVGRRIAADRLVVAQRGL